MVSMVTCAPQGIAVLLAQLQRYPVSLAPTVLPLVPPTASPALMAPCVPPLPPKNLLSALLVISVLLGVCYPCLVLLGPSVNRQEPPPPLHAGPAPLGSTAACPAPHYHKASARRATSASVEHLVQLPRAQPSFPGTGPVLWATIAFLGPSPRCRVLQAASETTPSTPDNCILVLCGLSIDSCSPCPPGHYCSIEGLASPSGLCAAGFYCPFDFSSTTPYAFLCPKGHYCPEGSPLALPCPTGEYQPNPGSDSCIPCRPGFYCEEAIVGEPWPCPPHSFCPAATMVPQPCPNGTFTPSDLGGLQEERECLPCLPGRFCRAGKIQGRCAAGYLCMSGSYEFTPQGPHSNWSQCEWGMQCAGPCPAGFYCPEGSEKPDVCPDKTIRVLPGAANIHDCLPCPPQHWCKKGHYNT
ncbi:keratinocyte proline-rich protein-like [Salvelinus fontinalis]|uniref:keratinocyte proline-rich protein-like n=1 Tax=Salvelinus fontinalis TaxID=8038 RepID=UPI002485EDD4|nr:keratinocyte proline-rich protein-like [Salvelinus fontinalis]